MRFPLKLLLAASLLSMALPAAAEQFILAIKNEDNFKDPSTGTVYWLNHRSELRAAKVPDALNAWLDEGGWTSTSHYNPGQKNYYAPVGLVLSIQDLDHKALGNWGGDGNAGRLIIPKNASDANKMDAQIRGYLYKAFDEIRKELNGKAPAGWHAHAAAIDDFEKMNTMRSALALPLAGKDKEEVVKIMQHAAVEALREYYQKTDAKQTKLAIAYNQRILGPGNKIQQLKPWEEKIRTAHDQIFVIHGDSDTTDVKYTETLMQVGLADVEGVFYSETQGHFPNPDVPDAIKSSPSWLQNREALARAMLKRLTEEMHGKVPHAPKLFALHDGQLQEKH